MNIENILESVDAVNDGHLQGLLESLEDINDLGSLQMFKETLKQCIEQLTDAAYCLTEYIEPWQCPNCSALFKVPIDPENMRHCPKCKNNNCFPYIYIQQEILNERMKILLPCVQYYSSQPNGAVATNAIIALSGVKNIPKKA